MRKRSVACLLLLALTGAVIAGEPEGDTFYRSRIYPLALNVYHESRGEPDLGKLMVAYVTLKRAQENRSEWGGSTITGVIHKGCQFSWTCGPKKEVAQGPEWEQSVGTATLAALELFEPPSDEMALARYYMNPDESSQHSKCWMATHFKQVALVGKHYFYRELLPGEKVSYVPPRFKCTA